MRERRGRKLLTATVNERSARSFRARNGVPVMMKHSKANSLKKAIARFDNNLASAMALSASERAVLLIRC